MELLNQTVIQSFISQYREQDNAATLRSLGRNVLYGKAAMYAYALQVYKSGEVPDWHRWIKASLRNVASYRDIYMVSNGAEILSRLDNERDLFAGKTRIDSWFFITKRLSYLQDATPVLRKIDHFVQGQQLFRQVITSTATLSRSDLREYLDLLQFKDSQRATCRRQSKAGLVTFTIVCDEQQAAKLEVRLSRFVAVHA